MQNPFKQEITIEPFTDSLNTWQLPTAALSSVYIALLTTMLSYQLTAIAYNLLQGRLTMNHTTASALQAHLLAINTSPLAVISALCRSDRVDRCRFPKLPPGTLPRSKEKTRIRSAVSLLLVILAAPTATVIAVFVTFERTIVFSIGQTGFGGVALGAGEPMELKHEEPSRCVPITLSVPPSFSTRVDFIRCVDLRLLRTYPETDRKHVIGEVEARNDGSVLVRLSGPFARGARAVVSVRVYALIRTDKGSFRIAHTFSRQDAERVIQVALMSFNDTSEISDVEAIERGGALLVRQKFRLTEGSFHFLLPFENMLRSVRLVRTPEMRLVTNKSSVLKAKDIPFVEYKRGMLSEGALGVLVCTLILARIMMRCLVVNNSEAGIESVLKSYFGEKQSLLKRSDTVRYDYSYVVHGEVWYGVKRHGVEEFQAPIGGPST